MNVKDETICRICGVDFSGQSERDMLLHALIEHPIEVTRSFMKSEKGQEVMRELFKLGERLARRLKGEA